MPSTYMGLTNRLLRRLNEVEITESDFPSVIGIQAAAKDSILDTVREINTSKIDWPFNAVEHSQTLQLGVEEYAWPANFSAADWNSFQLQKNDTLNINNKVLKLITREQWYNNLRDQDYDSETEGKNVPEWVFPSHGMGWGVSPSPNEEYPIKFRYYKNPADLELFDDEVTIPSKFDYVIIAGALWHLNLFKENAEAASMSKTAYDKGVDNMTNMFLPNPTYAYSAMSNTGGDIVGGFLTDRIWRGY
jgi:hypothetical protein